MKQRSPILSDIRVAQTVPIVRFAKATSRNLSVRRSSQPGVHQARRFSGSTFADFGPLLVVRALWFALLLWVTLSTPAVPVDGSIDSTFGSSGKSTISFAGGDNVYGSYLQPDGKMILVGGSTISTSEDMCVARFNADGSIDTGFATGGKYTLEVTTGKSDRATGVGLQSNGKIIVGGYTRFASGNDNFVVFRLTAGGVLDSSFGTGGITQIDFNGKTDRATAIKVLADDSILVGGWANDAAALQSDLAVAKLTAGGALDTSFGTGGKATVNIGDSQDSGNALAVQSDGKIILAGISGNNGDSVFKQSITRLTANGVLDTTFGTGGKLFFVLGSSLTDGILALHVQPDDKIVACGYSIVVSGNTDAFIERFTKDGAFDATFNGSGYRVVDLGSGSDQFMALTRQGNGKLLAGGLYINGSNYYDSVLARFNTNGTFDTAFGTSGIGKYSFGLQSDQIKGLGIQSSGKIVAAIQSSDAVSSDDFCVARFNVFAPSVTSITRLNPSTASTSASSLTFRVIFSSSVTGVDTSDYILSSSAGGSIASVVANSGSSYDVTVNSVAGPGSVRLDLKSSGTGIQDAAGNDIAGGYTSGETYTITASAGGSTTTTVTASPNSATHGSSITFSAQVQVISPGTGIPNGSVSFFVDNALVGSATLNASGIATLSSSSLPAGLLSLSAVYAGSGSFGGSSGSTSLSVQQAASIVDITSTPNPSVYGDPVTIVATVRPVAPAEDIPTGNVTFDLGNGMFDVAPVNAQGVASVTVNNLLSGWSYLTATYTGDLNFAPSSSYIEQSVLPAPTVTTVSSSPNPSVYGQPVTFTATVAPSSAPLGTPFGLVSFNVNGTILTVPIGPSGTASLTTSGLPIGSSSVTATYLGAWNFAASSGTTSQTVAPSGSAILLTASPNSPQVRQPVTITATVSATAPGEGTPTGPVHFFLDGMLVAMSSLTNGVATLVTPGFSAVGTHSIMAIYLGDTHYSPTPTNGTVLVAKGDTTAALSITPNPSVAGETVTIRATIAPATIGAGQPGGVVSFSIDGATGLSATIDGMGAASVSLPLPLGEHSIVATYEGDETFNGSTATASSTVNKGTTSLSLTSSPSPSVYGQPITFTATVAPIQPATGTPTGTVKFSFPNGLVLTSALNSSGVASVTTTGQQLGAPIIIGPGIPTPTPGAPIIIGPGIPTPTTGALAVGTHAVSATYNGDSNFSASSGSASHTVTPGSTTTAVSSSPSPSVYGQPVTLTATVAATGPSAGIPTGTVTFSIPNGPSIVAVLNASGVGTITTGGLSVGPHAVTASYSGDNNFSASSGSASQTVAPGSTTTTVSSSPAPSVYGQPVTFTATVSPIQPAPASPTGTVTFTFPNGLVLTSPLNSSGFASVTPTGLQLNAPIINGPGIATAITSALGVGTHAVSASYSGDSNFSASSGSALQTVAPGSTTTTVSSSPAPSVYGQPVTLTATVAASGPSAGTPTGTVTFTVANGQVMSAVLNSSGVATVSTSALSVGAHGVSASYSGDDNFSASFGSASQTVAPGSTTTTVSSSAAPSVYGQPVTLTATVAAVAPSAGTPTGTVTFNIANGPSIVGVLNASGVATATTSALSVGSHAVTVAYSGDSCFSPSSGSGSQTVLPGSSVTTVTASPNPAVYGQSVTLTANVVAAAPAAGVPAGTVTFVIAGGPSLIAPLDSSGVAAVTTSVLSAGTHAITASYSGSVQFAISSGASSVTVNKAEATVTLGSLSHVYDGTPRSASATTVPSGLPIQFAYDGSGVAPTGAGSYQVTATVTDPNYTGSATGTLVITKAQAMVNLGNLVQVYNGTARPVTAVTTPSGLVVSLSYDGSSAAPVGAGSYQVVGTINDPNYTGSSTATLIVNKAEATIALSSLVQVYDGTPKGVSTSTSPTGLNVALTYDGSGSAPVHSGNYAVTATIQDANYVGSTIGTLSITRAEPVINVTGFEQVYNGSPRPVVASTVPAGLDVTLSYAGGAAAPVNAGRYEVIASVDAPDYAGAVTNTLVISKAPVDIAFSNLSHTFDGSAKAATVSTVPANLAFTVTYNASETLPVNAGSYELVVTINDGNYAGSATGTFVIQKKSVPIALTSLYYRFDGTPKGVMANTAPVDLNVAFTYNGSSTPPSAAGVYEAIGTIMDQNYAGRATNTLVIEKAAGTVEIGGLSQAYDGAPKAATVRTTPAGLSVRVTYNGSTVLPVNPGSYTVVATVDDLNITATATAQLTISRPKPIITLNTVAGQCTLGAPAVVLDPAAEIASVARSQGSRLVVTVVSNGCAADRLAIERLGENDRLSLSDKEVLWDNRSVARWEFSANTQPTLALLFTADSSLEVTREVLRRISFQSSITPVLRERCTIEFLYTDGVGMDSDPVAFELALNNPPMAAPDQFVTGTNLPLRIGLEKLLANDTDRNDQPLAVTSAATNSTQGGQIVRSSTGLIYTPAPGFVGQDDFTYVVSDGNGGTSTGKVCVSVLPERALAVESAPTTKTEEATIAVMGIPGFVYDLYASDDLVAWIHIATFTAPEGGLSRVADGAVANSNHRFYRVVNH